MTVSERRRILLPLCGLAVVLMLLPVLVLSGMTRATKLEIGNEFLSREATTIATDLASEMTRAAMAGIPLDRIPGVDGYFQGLLQQYSSIRFFALLATDGRILDVSGATQDQIDLLRSWPKRRLPAERPDAAGDLVSRVLRKGENPVMVIGIATPSGQASLVYGAGPASPPPVLTPEVHLLVLMLMVLFLLGLPILCDTVNRTIFRPILHLDRQFAAAAGGRFGFLPADRGRNGFTAIVRLWNNEVLSRQERHNQFATFAREAVGAADDPAVAREIERLLLIDPGQAEPAPALDERQPGFGSEVRVPALLLAFLAVTAFGNWPGPAPGIAAAAGLLCGLAAGWALAGRQAPLARAGLSAGCLAVAAVMLASAISPYLLPQDALLGMIWVVPNALLLGFLTGAALRRPAGQDARRDNPRRESVLLLSHLAAGLLAALIWNYGGLSATDDTLEVWIAALALPVVAGLLRARS